MQRLDSRFHIFAGREEALPGGLFLRIAGRAIARRGIDDSPCHERGIAPVLSVLQGDPDAVVAPAAILNGYERRQEQRCYQQTAQPELQPEVATHDRSNLVRDYRVAAASRSMSLSLTRPGLNRIRLMCAGTL